MTILKTMARYGAAALVVAVALTACGEAGEDEVAPEVLLERATAFRMACASAELERTAAEDLEILESTVQFYEETDSAGGGVRPTANAAVEFARGYLQHAELRAAAYALLDSATNHSATPEDSARFVERAQAFTIRAPDEGTVERNVIESYQGNLSALLGDDDHQCNWDIPGLRRPAEE